jgi:hypothetical protein
MNSFGFQNATNPYSDNAAPLADRSPLPTNNPPTASPNAMIPA